MTMSAERNTNDIELLSAYLDGQLTEAERSTLETRLQNEPELRQQMAELRATVGLIKELPTLSAPRDFRLTHAMAHGQRQQPHTYVFSILSAAAAIVLFVVGFGLLSRSMSTTSPLTTTNFTGDTREETLLPEVANLPTQTEAATVEAFSLRYSATETFEQEDAIRDQAGSDAGTAADGQQSQATTLLPQSTLLVAPALDAAAATSSDTENSAGTAIEEFSAPAEQDDEAASQAELLLQAPSASGTATPLPTLGTVAGAVALQPTEKPTKTPAPTLARPTATETPTETLTMTLSSTPTDTPSPTNTVFPTPAPLPIQPPASAVDTGALGVILIAGSIVLFAAALYLFVINRRR
jgi:hypothetical protein